MNETERIAIKYLHSIGDIVDEENSFKPLYPDLLCFNGKKYEVKKAYPFHKNRFCVTFSKFQMKYFESNTLVLIFMPSEENPRFIFTMEDIRNKKYPNSIYIRIDNKTRIIIKTLKPFGIGGSHITLPISFLGKKVIIQENIVGNTPKMPEQKCDLCGKIYKGFGNNAMPIFDGDCCDECYQNKVIPERLNKIINSCPKNYYVRKVKKFGYGGCHVTLPCSEYGQEVIVIVDKKLKSNQLEEEKK